MPKTHHSPVLIILLGLMLTAAFGQSPDPRDSLPDTIKQGPGLDRVPVTSGDPMQREQLRKMFEMRQEKIRRDTETLAQLSNELKQNVNSAGPTVLSLETIKKVEAIEKLAKSIKQQMRADR